MEQRDSSQSLELDILRLTEQWEARKTIRNGDTPGQALKKGPRPALAAIPTNVLASAAAAGGATAAANPFSLTVQRQKAAVASKLCHQQQQPPAQQTSVRFAVDEPQPLASGHRRQRDADAENVPTAVASSAATATAATAATSEATPASQRRALGAGGAGTGAVTGAGAGSVGPNAGSPSPYILFRGRLSFAQAEADSARKFDRPTTAHRAAAGGALKRKLLISPDADISAAFPTLRKPATKQRRRSLGELARAGSSSAAGIAGMAAGTDVDGSSGGFGHYWSDPLPLPQSDIDHEVAAAAAGEAGAGVGDGEEGAQTEVTLAAGIGCRTAVGTSAAAAAAAAAAAESSQEVEEDMQDTAASPASSSGGGSPAAAAPSGMDECCGAGSQSPPPAFSPLPGALQHALPTVDHPSCGFPSITPQTLRDLLAHGAAAFGLSDYVVVDCRHSYEHEGGCVPGAVHLTTPEELQSFLSARPPPYWQTTAIIFHCEFSTERGPRAAKHVRKKDREAHLHDYPALTHPHVFVLQGGYKAFWKAFPEQCQGGYRPMDHPDFSQQLKACHNIVKKAWDQTTRTFCRKQRQRRPSYRLRQSTGAPIGSGRDCAPTAATATVAADGCDAGGAVTAAELQAGAGASVAGPDRTAAAAAGGHSTAQGTVMDADGDGDLMPLPTALLAAQHTRPPTSTEPN